MNPTNAEGALVTAIEQLTNLVAIGITRDMRQVEAIRLLVRSSLSNIQIAAIVGTTPDTVRAERNRRKRIAKGPARKARPDGSVTD